MAQGAHASHDPQGNHISSLPQYLQIFGALLVLTVVTVAVSYLDMPQPLSIIVAMGVATVKASLVAIFFMHLKYDDKFNALVLLGSVAFLVLFFLFTLVDLETRGAIIPEQENFSWEADQAWRQKMLDEAPPEPPALAPDPSEYLK